MCLIFSHPISSASHLVLFFFYVDTAAEEAVLAVLRRYFGSSHAILGEEGGVSGDTTYVSRLSRTRTRTLPCFYVCVCVCESTPPSPSPSPYPPSQIAVSVVCGPSGWHHELYPRIPFLRDVGGRAGEG